MRGGCGSLAIGGWVGYCWTVAGMLGFWEVGMPGCLQNLDKLAFLEEETLARGVVGGWFGWVFGVEDFELLP